MLDQPTGEAVDGDTLRMENGGKLRMFGIDAPELKQQGWDRQGNPVPIGQNSRVALDAITTPNAIPGPQVGSSYGRPVAPVTDKGLDVGEQQIRTGNALAAPSFMEQDAARRFRYMQAERLARLNRLGINQTYMQSPQDFRRDPIASPERETIAQFWDTPTPWAGMRPEDEKKYVELLQTATAPNEIVSFVKSAGADINPADAAQWIKDRDAARAKGTNPSAYVRYGDRPPVMTDQGDGAAGAGARGLANGVLPNFLEETGAIVDTLGGTNNRENIWNSDRRLADIYANNAAQNEAITRYDAFAHPYVTTGSQIVGGLAVPMGRISSAADLAKFGAGYGALSGLGREGSIPERLTSGVVGAGEGLALTVGGGKALEAAAPYVGKGLRYAGEKFGIRAPAEVPPPPDGFAVDAPGSNVAGQADAPAPVFQPEPASPTGNPGSPRQRDWIDVGSVPPPPPGYRLNNPGSMGMDAQRGPSISQDMPGQPVSDFPGQPYPISQPISAEQLRAATQDIRPSDLLPIPSNEVGSVEELAASQAGRFAAAKPVKEASVLESRTYRTANGREVSHRGPADLVTWIRTQGGLKDQGGNLRAMGFDNKPRDLDFARGEQRLGKLVDNEAGMNLDDAAYKAWEAGYLPGSERPDVNAFLDALDRTHSGAERFYHPDDLAEVSRFEGTRADRRQLEEQLADGPVFVDRSAPATEPQPFPPAQAYEEWPAGGPDFAGNIDLRKLESPQDISRALDFTNRRVGFDAATRGRVSHVETERLASDLGMTADQLLARRRGQALNAEEALAARQILAKSGNELVNLARRVKSMDVPGDDLVAEFQQAWMRHAAIQEQVSGMTAEAGRALQQFRMLANSRAVKADVLAAMVGSGGGRKRIQDAADVLLDAVETGQPGKFNTIVEQGSKPQFRDKLTELWINSLLTNPATHVVNMTSNTLTSLAQIPEHAAAWGVGKVRQALPNASADRVISSEIGVRAFGLIQGAKEGARHFAQALRTGEPVDLVSKVEQQNMKAISGLKGELVRIPTRLLGAEDEFFKGMARRMELNGLAARQARSEGLKGEAASKRIAELVTNPPDAMLAKAMDYARYVTFQQKLGPTASKLSAATQDHRWTKLFLPFVRTPTNLIKFAAERSPLAPVMKSWRADIQAGGSRRDLAIAKMMVGTGFGAAMYEAALSGKITGSTPPDDAKARLLYADGWQPYSVRIGDKWYSYKRLDPFSTTIGTAADLALLPENMSEHQREDMTTLFIASIMGNLASKTWLSGVSDVLGAITQPEQNAGRLRDRLIGSLAVPAGVAGAARTIDPIARETETWTDAIQARIPFASRSLPPRRDVWGELIQSEGGVGPDFASPIYTSTAKNDPVNREMMGLGYAPTKPKDEIGGQKLTPQQYDRYQIEAGRRAHQSMARLITTPEWQALDLEGREELAKKAVRQAREEAKWVVFGAPQRAGRVPRVPPRLPDGAPPPPPGFTAPAGAYGKATAALTPPPPAGFKVDGEAGGVNVYADLLKGIPGMTASNFTSGFRTPQYQALMRLRGYKPATNSEHLDGSALDMVPPAGKSFEWLKERVRALRPDARLLIHGGHLHATFPGYYGAPVLGGAKSAGLRNPNAGMPPPPKGFKLN